MGEKETVYRLENYGKKSAFASFLPGISGVRGIPIWCYYVNRGQCIACFGVENKDHAIMEFSPAHQAYQTVKKTGFRTFVKKNGRVFVRSGAGIVADSAWHGDCHERSGH